MGFSTLKIKVSDLLHSRVTDSIVLENIRLANMPNLTPEGINGMLLLQPLDHQGILAKLYNISATFLETCECCGLEFSHSVLVEEYSANFLKTTDMAQELDDVFFIDIKNSTIDIKDMLYHALGLHQPLVVCCDSCKQDPQRQENEIDWFVDQ